MAGKIGTGSILIRESTVLPDSLRLESEQCSSGWRWVKDFDGYGLDREIREAGWTFFYLAGQVRASVFGLDNEKTTRKAIQRVLANLKCGQFNKWGQFNCLQITQVAAKRFLGLPYVSVSAHWRHIQESMFLCRAQRVAEWDRAKLVAL